VTDLWQKLYYCVGLHALGLGAKLASRKDGKIEKALAGRREPRCASSFAATPRLWFHASSLGEFEQAKPVIEALGKRYPSQAVWVSFFSPSGLEYSRNYEHVEDVFYLPLLKKDVRSAFEIIHPHAVIDVKVDHWPGLIWEARSRDVPTILIDATLSPDSKRNLRSIRSIQRSYYSCLSEVIAVAEPDAGRLRSLCGPDVPIKVGGDSKFDRVWQRANTAKSSGRLDNLLKGVPGPVLVAGSTYDQEENLLAEAFAALGEKGRRLSVVVVPHEPTAERIRRSLDLFGKTGWDIRRFSEITPGDSWEILLLDTVGILAECYKHADFVLVGGSYRAKVHNVLEPAVFGKPIVVGPFHKNSPEAVEMIREGSVLQADDVVALTSILSEWIDRPKGAISIGVKAKSYLESRLGASEIIADELQSALGLTTSA